MPNQVHWTVKWTMSCRVINCPISPTLSPSTFAMCRSWVLTCWIALAKRTTLAMIRFKIIDSSGIDFISRLSVHSFFAHHGRLSNFTIFTLRCQSHNRRSRVIAVFSGSIITHRVIRHGRLARRMVPRWTVSSTLTQASSPCCIRMKWAGWSYKGRRVPCTDASLNSFLDPIQASGFQYHHNQTRSSLTQVAQWEWGYDLNGLL